MTYFLADTENIADRWYCSALDAEPGDVFLLFYSDRSNKRQGFDIFAQASLRGVNFRFIKCYNKRENALDFQLTAYLGVLFASHPDDRFVILSRDEGFDSAVLFLQDLGADVRRFAPPVRAVIPAPALARTYDEAVLPADPIPATPSGGSLPDDVLAVLPAPKSEIRRFIDSLPSCDRGVAGYYETGLLELGVTGERDLAEAVEILYEAMKAPLGARRAATYKAFLHKYGIKDGQARYRPIKDFVAGIAANGPVPEQVPDAGPESEPVLPTPSAGESDPKDEVPAPESPVPASRMLQDACPGLSLSLQHKIMRSLVTAIQTDDRAAAYRHALEGFLEPGQADEVYSRTEHILHAMVPMPQNGSGKDPGGGFRSALEADIASACPELTEAQVAEVHSAMAEAKRINPKNLAAGYGMTLKRVFPDPAVKKSVFTRTKGLLPRA